MEDEVERQNRQLDLHRSHVLARVLHRACHMIQLDVETMQVLSPSVQVSLHVRAIQAREGFHRLALQAFLVHERACQL
eukprot:6563550-Alexandrium_andersonii.AAC.1